MSNVDLENLGRKRTISLTIDTGISAKELVRREDRNIIYILGSGEGQEELKIECS